MAGARIPRAVPAPARIHGTSAQVRRVHPCGQMIPHRVSSDHGARRDQPSHFQPNARSRLVVARTTGRKVRRTAGGQHHRIEAQGRSRPRTDGQWPEPARQSGHQYREVRTCTPAHPRPPSDIDQALARLRRRRQGVVMCASGKHSHAAAGPRKSGWDAASFSGDIGTWQRAVGVIRL